MSEYKKLYHLYETIQKGEMGFWNDLVRTKFFPKLLSISISPLSEKEQQKYLNKLQHGKTTSEEENLRAKFGGSNPLLIATEMGQLKIVQSILKLSPALIHKTDIQGNNVFHLLAKTRVTDETLNNFFELFQTLVKQNPSLLLQKNHLGLTPIDLFATTNRAHLKYLFTNQSKLFSSIIPQFSDYQNIAENGHVALRNFVLEKLIRDIPDTSAKKLSNEQLKTFDLRTLGQRYGFEFDNDDDLNEIFEKIRNKSLSYQSKYPPIVLLNINLQKSTNLQEKIMAVINYKMRQSINILPAEQQQLVLQELNSLYNKLTSFLSEKKCTYFDKKQITPIIEKFLESIKGLNSKQVESFKKLLIDSLSQKNPQELQDIIKKASDNSFRAKVLSRSLRAPAFLSPQQFLSNSAHITSDILVDGQHLLQLNLVGFMKAFENDSELKTYFNDLVKDIIDTKIFKTSSIEQKTQLLSKYLSYFSDQVTKLYSDKNLAHEFKTRFAQKASTFIDAFVKTKLTNEHNELFQAYLELYDPDSFNQAFSSTKFYSLVHHQSLQWLEIQLKEFDEPTQKTIRQYYEASQNSNNSQKTSYEIGLSNAIINTQTVIQKINKNIVSDASHLKAKSILIKQLNKLVQEFNSKIQGHESLSQEFKKYFASLNKRVSGLLPEQLTHEEYHELKKILEGISTIEKKIQALNILGQSENLNNLFENFISSTIPSSLKLKIFRNLDFLSFVNHLLQTEVYLVEKNYLDGLVKKLSDYNKKELQPLISDLKHYQSKPNRTKEDFENCCKSFETTLAKISQSKSGKSLLEHLSEKILSFFRIFKEIEKPMQLFLKSQMQEFKKLGLKP